MYNFHSGHREVFRGFSCIPWKKQTGGQGGKRLLILLFSSSTSTTDTLLISIMFEIPRKKKTTGFWKLPWNARPPEMQERLSKPLGGPGLARF